MNKLIYLATLLILICISCKEKHNKYNIQNNQNVNASIMYDSVCILKENIDIMGRITSINFLDSSHFVIVTAHPDMSIFIYDTQGNQLKKIQKIGRGPYEYLSPSLIRCYDEKIYIWCDKLLKLIVLDKYGNPIEEYNNFKRAISNFTIWKDYICFYTSGGFKDYFIEIYDQTTKKNIFSGGDVSEEHSVLNMVNPSGGLSISDSTLYFTSADKLIIYSMNMHNFELESYEFGDNDFKVSPLGESSANFINYERNKVVDYLLSNSLITNLFSIHNYSILQTEVGVYLKNEQSIDNSARFIKYYFIDKNMKTVTSVKTNYDKHNNNSLYTNYNNTIFNIRFYLDNETPIYQLSKLNFKIPQNL